MARPRKQHTVEHTDSTNLGGMSDEAKAKFEAKRKADEEKMAYLLKKQTTQKMKQTLRTAPRDPNKIRGIAGDDQIECIAVRKIGLDNNETSEAGEKVMIPRAYAGHLQDSGAIKVAI